MSPGWVQTDMGGAGATLTVHRLTSARWWRVRFARSSAPLMCTRQPGCSISPLKAGALRTSSWPPGHLGAGQYCAGLCGVCITARAPRSYAHDQWLGANQQGAQAQNQGGNPISLHRQLPAPGQRNVGRTRRGVDDRKNLSDHETLNSAESQQSETRLREFTEDELHGHARQCRADAGTLNGAIQKRFGGTSTTFKKSFKSVPTSLGPRIKTPACAMFAVGPGPWLHRIGRRRGLAPRHRD